MKSIFLYRDYLDYLNDFLQDKKKENPYFSNTVWARKLGLKSSSILSMILTKERLPSRSLIEKFANYFQLNTEEAAYFKALVDFKKIGKNNLLKINIEQSETISRDAKVDDFLSPFTFILKELMTTDQKIIITKKWLKENLIVKRQRFIVEKMIQALIDKNVIKVAENGEISFSDKADLSLFFNPKNIQNFHNESLEMTKDAYETSTKNERTFHSSYLKLRPEKLQEAKEKIKKFQSEFTSYVEEGEGDFILYQMNVHLFPLSKKINSL